MTLGALLSVAGAGIAAPAGSFAAEQRDEEVSNGEMLPSLAPEGQATVPSAEVQQTEEPQPTGSVSNPSEQATQSDLDANSTPDQSETTGDAEQPPAMARRTFHLRMPPSNCGRWRTAALSTLAR